MPLSNQKLVGIRHFAKSPRPDERAKCSAWAKCLEVPGDCNAARSLLRGASWNESQCLALHERDTRRAISLLRRPLNRSAFTKMRGACAGNCAGLFSLHGDTQAPRQTG